MRCGNGASRESGQKNDEAHIIPLSDAALEVIENLPRIHGAKGYLFTTTGETAASGFSRAKAAIDKAMGSPPHRTFHDLRRTLASGMAQLGIQLPVIEKVLNDRSGSFSGIVGVYQRHDFADEKRKALENGALRHVARRGQAGPQRRRAAGLTMPKLKR